MELGFIRTMDTLCIMMHQLVLHLALKGNHRRHSDWSDFRNSQPINALHLKFWPDYNLQKAAGHILNAFAPWTVDHATWII